MRKMIFAITAAAMALFIVSMIVPDVSAQSAAIDEDGIIIDNEEPEYTDTVTVSVPVIFVDAEPVEDGVVLKWKLCTENTCEIPTTTVMEDDGNGTYSATIGGPFPTESSSGEPYIDVGLTIEVTYVPTGGGDEQTEKTEEKLIYFNENTTTQPDDDDDTDDTDDDDDQEEEDSPFGMEIALIGVLIAAGIIAFRKRK